MSKKSLTKDCPNCQLCSADENTYNFLCNWGRNKKRKILYETKNMKNCTLRR